MKSFMFLALALCAYAHGATTLGNEIVNNVKELVGFKEASVLMKDKRIQDRGVVADAIMYLLNGFRETVVNGDPPLDPLYLEEIGPFELSSTGIRINAGVRNFNMEGLRWYVVDHVTFNALRLAIGVQITVPWLIFTGSYDADARILLLSHEAGGNYRIFVNRMETSVDIRVGTNLWGGGTLILRELEIRISIQSIQINIDGMVGSETLNSLINSMAQNAAQTLLVDQLEEISEQLSKELFDAVNDFLGNFTLDDLLG